jgi:hypothetical protein
VTTVGANGVTTTSLPTTTSGGMTSDGSVSSGGASSTNSAATGGATGGTGGGDFGLEIDDGDLILWYDEPAGVFNEALPVGNGRLGAMVFGDPASDKIELNENTFWSGGPSRNDNPQALGVLDQVRQLIFNGSYTEAESMINSNMTASQLHGSMYQPIGNLNLDFPGHGSASSYYRELDLKRAVATTSYDVGGVTFTREVFSSNPTRSSWLGSRRAKLASSTSPWASMVRFRMG